MHTQFVKYDSEQNLMENGTETEFIYLMQFFFASVLYTLKIYTLLHT